MMNEIEKRHPRKIVNRKSQFYPLCRSHSGFHICCKRYRKSNLVELGSGICLYFKMLKFLMGLFFIFTVLSIPKYYFYWSGNNYLTNQNSGIDFSGIDYVLSAVSIGNLGEATKSCSPSKVVTNTNMTVNLTC
jgi:hypothetical protein